MNYSIGREVLLHVFAIKNEGKGECSGRVVIRHAVDVGLRPKEETHQKMIEEEKYSDKNKVLCSIAPAFLPSLRSIISPLRVKGAICFINSWDTVGSYQTFRHEFSKYKFKEDKSFGTVEENENTTCSTLGPLILSHRLSTTPATILPSFKATHSDSLSCLGISNFDGYYSVRVRKSVKRSVGFGLTCLNW